MAYQFDRKKYEDIYDEMFGKGAREAHLARSGDIGRQIGELKRNAKEREAANKILEAAAKEAAKKERERAKEGDKPKSKTASQIDDKKFRIEQAGGDPNKKQSAFGKAVNLDVDNNVLFDALDLLSRPLNAQQEINKTKIEKMTEHIQSGESSKKDIIKKGISETLGLLNPLFRFDPIVDNKEATKAALDGLSGREKTFGSDVLEAAGVEKGVGRTIGGIALDVYSDPLNAVGGVIGKGVTGGAKLVGKGASMLPGADKVTDFLGNVFGKTKMQKTLTGQRTDDLIDLARQTENERLYMINKSQEDVSKAMREAGGMDKGVDVGRAMEQPLANNVLPQPATAAGPITPEIQRATQTLVNSNADIRAYAQANGLTINDLEGYMSHFITQEARKALNAAGKTVSDGVSSVGGNKAITQRTMHDTVENVNAQLRQMTGIDEVFTPNAFLATAGGQHRYVNYVARESIKNKVLADTRFAREIQQGTKVDKGFVKKEIDGKYYELTKGADEVITNFSKHVTDDGVDSLLKGFDKIQNIWKKTALFSLGYHARNIVGNSWNMYASGMRADEVLRYHTEALHHIDNLQAHRVGKTTRADKAIDATYDEFLRQGLKNTGSTADFAGVGNIDRALMDGVANASNNALGKLTQSYKSAVRPQGSAWEQTKALADAPFESSRQLGNIADEVSRFAMFKWARDSGMSAKQAADKVREVLFDYTDLTKVEREGFKRMMPFYTWMRKNSEFQIKAFAKNPDRYNRLNIIKENAWDNSDMDREIIPEWLDNNLAMPIPGMDRLANVSLPAADLVKMANPLKMGLDSLSPVAKVPLEFAMDRSTFNGQPIQQFEGQNGNILGMEFEGLPFLPGSGKQQQYALENLLAPVRNISGAIDRQNDGESPLDVMSKLMGADLARNYDEEGFRGQFEFNESKRLDDIIKRMEKQEGTDVQTKSELANQGIYPPNDHRAEATSVLQEMGYNERQVDMLIAMKQKVYNNNAAYANQVANLLSQQGLPPEVIDLITSDYLDY